MTIEQMTPEEEVKLRLAAGISPSTPTEYMLRHIPLWVKMSILRRNVGIGGVVTKGITTFNFTSNIYQENGRTVSLGDISEFNRLSSATMWQEDGSVVEVDANVPRISDEGLLIEPQRTNSAVGAVNSYFTGTDQGATIWGQIDGALSDKEDFYRLEKVNKAVTPNFHRYRIGAPYPEGIVTGSIFLRRGDSPARYFKLFSASSGFTNSSFDLDTYTASASGNPDNTLDARMDKKASIARASHSALKEDLRNVSIIGFSDTPLPSSYFSHLTQDGQYHLLSGVQIEDGLYPTSYIHTVSTPATRAPDILNIPILPTQTLSGDWDEGVTYEVADNIATFTGHGYIRNIHRSWLHPQHSSGGQYDTHL